MSTINIDAQMAWLEGEVGFREGANNQNPYGPWQGVRNAPYCDSFAQQGAVEAGGYRWPENSQFGWKGAAYCPYTEADSKALGLWRRASEYRQPRRGDQILFDWTGWGGADHIGTVWGTDDGYKTLWCVEGNSSTSPQGVHWVRRDWTYIRGFVALSDVGGGTAPPPPAPSGPRDLRRGFSGADVQALQQRLTDLGYHVPGGVDGDFGSGTEQAVMNFQNDWAKPVDGIVGEATRAALADDSHRADMQQPPAPEPEPPAWPQWPGVYYKRGDVDENVRVFQARLAERGWDIEADGWFGRATHRIVQKFQMNKNLEADGIVGPATWGAAWTEPIT